MTGEPLARRARFMLVSDLDWTMVDHGDFTHAALRAFNRLWLSAYAPDSLLVFSTGRSPPLFHELAAEVPLLTPDILVCSVGTEILINGQPDEEWEAHLNEGWDRARAAACAAELPELTLQRESEQRPHKVSYKLRVPDPDRVLSALRASLAAAGLQTNVIYSGGEDLDILPCRASKGKALSFLLKQLEAGPGRPEAGVMVCGDSGNDVELFAVPGVHGCMVANAHAELRDWCAANGHDQIFAATRDGPGGIREALQHFSFLNPSPPDTVPRRQALVAQQEWAEEWTNGSVPQGAALVEKRMQAFAEGFELVGASGTVQSRAQLADRFVREGHGCARGGVASALAAAPPAVAEAAKAADKAGAEPGSHSRMGGWMDSYSERQLAHGLWVVRWMDLWQPFAAGKATAAARVARWCSAVLRLQQDGTYHFEYMHESSDELPPHHDPREIIASFRATVNMSPEEVEGWLDTAESRLAVEQVGEEADKKGRHAARRVIELLRKDHTLYYEGDFKHMWQITNYILCQRERLQREMQEAAAGGGGMGAREFEAQLRSNVGRWHLCNFGYDPLRGLEALRPSAAAGAPAGSGDKLEAAGGSGAPAMDWQRP